MPGDLLGVDRVLLDPRPSVGLVVPGAVELALGVRDLDLEALPGARLLRDRPSASSAAVFCSISSAAVSRRAGSASSFSSPIRPVRCARRCSISADVRLLEAEPLLGLRELRDPEPQQDVVVLGLRLAELLLDLRPAAEPAVHLAVLQLVVGRSPPGGATSRRPRARGRSGPRRRR